MKLAEAAEDILQGMSAASSSASSPREIWGYSVDEVNLTLSHNIMPMNDVGFATPSGPRPIFSSSGTWLAFVTPDNLVWRPDVSLIGHVVADDVFSNGGAYLGTIEGNVLIFRPERSALHIPRADVPVNVPGYPGLPQANLIRSLGPSEIIGWAANATT